MKLTLTVSAIAVLAGSAAAQTPYVNGTDTNGNASWSNPDPFTYSMSSGSSGNHFAGWLIANPAPGFGGTVTYDWSWSTSDSAVGYDYPVVTLNGQAQANLASFGNPPPGTWVPDGFSFGGGLAQSGSGSFLVAGGDVDFGFAVRQDGCCGNGTLNITNMVFTPIPAPGAMALVGVAGLAAARRRR